MNRVSLYKSLLSASQFAANGLKRAVRRGIDVAVAGKGEDRLSEGNGLVVEGMSKIVSHVRSIFVESPWNLSFVSCSPEIVVAEIA